MNVNLDLRHIAAALAALFCLACLFSGFSIAYAQNPGAAPVPVVTEETLPVLGRAPIVVELFSSQACVFCPDADRLFADLLKQENVIGLACHVDYFDVKDGALSHKFCTERQSWYMEKLAAGPNYTPQMVINGRIDVVGYKFSHVVKGLQKALFSEILPLAIDETKTKGIYKVTLPFDELENPDDYRLWLALYDKPHEVVIAEGMNKGKKTTYYNIVSELGSTGNVNKTVYVNPPLEDIHAGFVVILQDMSSGKIYAVGRHKAD